MTRRIHRLPALLQLFTLDAPVTHTLVLDRLGWGNEIASSSLGNAITHGFIQNSGARHQGQIVYQLTGAGRERLGANAVVQPPDLAERAIALIVASEAGLDSEQLAEKLVCSNEQVMAALDQAADDHRVVACRLVRGGVEMRSYRKSAGAPVITPWQKLMATNAPAGEIAAARARGEAAKDVDIDAAHRKHKLDKLTPPTDPSVPADALESVTQSSAAAPPGAAAVEALADAIVVHSEQEAELYAADHSIWFALYSSGELNINRLDGSQVNLDSDETRALFAWLDRLGGTNLQRLAPADTEDTDHIVAAMLLPPAAKGDAR